MKDGKYCKKKEGKQCVLWIFQFNIESSSVATEMIGVMVPELRPSFHILNFNFQKLRVFVKEKFNVAQEIISVFDKTESIAGKGEMLVTSIASFSHNFFKSFFLRVAETRDCNGEV